MADISGVASGIFEGLSTGGGMMNRMNIEKEKLRQGAENIRSEAQLRDIEGKKYAADTQLQQQQIQLNQPDLESAARRQKALNTKHDFNDYVKQYGLQPEQVNILKQHLPIDATGQITVGDMLTGVDMINEEGVAQNFVGMVMPRLNTKLDMARMIRDAYMDKQYDSILKGMKKTDPRYEDTINDIIMSRENNDPKLKEYATQIALAKKDIQDQKNLLDMFHQRLLHTMKPQDAMRYMQGEQALDVKEKTAETKDKSSRITNLRDNISKLQSAMARISGSKEEVLAKEMDSNYKGNPVIDILKAQIAKYEAELQSLSPESASNIGGSAEYWEKYIPQSNTKQPQE